MQSVCLFGRTHWMANGARMLEHEADAASMEDWR